MRGKLAPIDAEDRARRFIDNTLGVLTLYGGRSSQLFWRLILFEDISCPFAAELRMIVDAPDFVGLFWLNALRARVLRHANSFQLNGGLR